MSQERPRPVAAGRDADIFGTVQTGRLHDTTTYSAPIELPPSMAGDYRCTCAAWATIHAHHRAVMRLLEVES
jgi:hypothetical protein